jgi:hypothetical protein
MGLIGTMAALVLGLLVASAKGFYDTQSSDLTEMSAKVVLLDRVLAHYGPETKEVRDLLHSAAARTLVLLQQPLTGFSRYQHTTCRLPSASAITNNFIETVSVKYGVARGFSVSVSTASR